MKILRAVRCLASFSLAALVGCELPTPSLTAAPPPRTTVEPVKNRIAITRLNWIFQNSPSDLGGAGSLRLDVSVVYSGANLAASDLGEASLASVDQVWDLLAANPTINDSTKTIGEGMIGLYSNTLSSNGSVMPLGPYIATLRLRDGFEISDTNILPAPGATGDPGISFLYTEDYAGSVTSSHHPMIRRPAVKGVSRSADTLSVTFATTDTLTYGGWIVLFDGSGAYLGASELLRDFSTKAMSSLVNGGGPLRLDGTDNVVKLTASRNQLVANARFADIRSLRVVITDGRQYAQTSDAYDCRAISPLAAVP